MVQSHFLPKLCTDYGSRQSRYHWYIIVCSTYRNSRGISINQHTTNYSWWLANSLEQEVAAESLTICKQIFSDKLCYFLSENASAEWNTHAGGKWTSWNCSKHRLCRLMYVLLFSDNITGTKFESLLGLSPAIACCLQVFKLKIFGNDA
jgi:hypothetical protein